MVFSNWGDVCPRAEWEALKASKAERRAAAATQEDARPAKVHHDMLAYRNLAGRQVGWCCQRCRSWTRKPGALQWWKDTPCKEGKWKEWGVQARRQCWMAHGDPLMKAGGTHLVPQMWEVHREDPKKG